jgi:hypothetical protein
MKTCSACKIEKEESEFHVSSKAKTGLQKQCKECRNFKARQYVKKHKEKYKEHRYKWLSQNRDKDNLNKKIRRKRVKGTDKEEKRKEYTKEQRQEMYRKRKSNPEWLERKRKKAREYERNRRKNILYRIENQIRCRTAIAIKGGPKIGKYEKYIGCTTEELKQYLENKFLPGMTWQNWGRYGWHIDHIIPISSFDLSNENDFLKAFHFTNLQPLWASDNLSKGSKISI